MCAGTVFYEDETEEADEMEHEIGLVPGHIYTLMAGYKIKINGAKWNFPMTCINFDVI